MLAVVIKSISISPSCNLRLGSIYYAVLPVQAGKGFLRAIKGTPKAVADLIPVDTVVNLTLAVGWYTAVNRCGCFLWLFKDLMIRGVMCCAYFQNTHVFIIEDHKYERVSGPIFYIVPNMASHMNCFINIASYFINHKIQTP